MRPQQKLACTLKKNNLIVVLAESITKTKASAFLFSFVTSLVQKEIGQNQYLTARGEKMPGQRIAPA